ncbi:hypothetical protein WJX79_002848 [Trebouxia sp. C0005]
MKDAWVLGAVLTVVGSIGINLGTNLMKLGYMQRESLDLDNSVAIWRFWQWQAGMLMFVVGNIANFVARAFASQSLLTGLGSVQFVSNLLFVVLVLKEKVPLRCILATFLIVAGNVLLVVFGSKTSPKYTVSQLAALYRQDSMAAYMIMAYGGVVPLAFTLYLYGQQTKRLMPTRTFALWSKALPVLYALFSSILGAHAVLFATSLCIIIVDLIEGSDVFTQWYTYLVVIGIIGMSIFWVGQLDRGLLLFPAVVIVPMLEIQWVLFIMVSGGLYFGDFEIFSKLQLAMFGVGGTNQQLRAMSIFAMPMIMPSMAFTSRQDIADHLPVPRIGIEAVYNRVSRPDISPDIPSLMFERQPAAARVPTPRNSMS